MSTTTHPQPIYIVVANTSLARFYQTDRHCSALQLETELEHPQSRQKASELVSDEQGRYATPGVGVGEYESADPKTVEAQHFAIELAKKLNHARTLNHFEELILIMPAHFMGWLMKHLDKDTSAQIIHRLEKDYTKISHKALETHLQNLMKS